MQRNWHFSWAERFRSWPGALKHARMREIYCFRFLSEQFSPPKTVFWIAILNYEISKTVEFFEFFACMYICCIYMQINKHSHRGLSAWELGPHGFLGPHPAFALALQLSTSFTWEWALVWRKSTQWHFPQCHIYRPLHRAGGTISQSDTVRPQPPWTIINCCPGGR